MPPTEEDLRAWVLAHVPEHWFSGPAQVQFDGDEILIVGAATGPDLQAFREETREPRMRIAHEAERQFGRKVSWGAIVDGEQVLFTTLSLPVMTRLRLPERQVLDTLVAAGVARSRSDALAWCVRLVGRHQGDWIRELQEALVRVVELRQRGPA